MIDELYLLLNQRYRQLYGQRRDELDLLVIRQRRIITRGTESGETVWELRLPLEKPRWQSAKQWHYDNLGSVKKTLGLTFQARSFQSVVAQALVFIQTTPFGEACLRRDA